MTEFNIVDLSNDSAPGTMTGEYRHIPVLLAECASALDPLALSTSEPVFVDATLGFAGHSHEMARLLGEAAAKNNKPASDSLLIGIDQDTQAIEAAKSRLFSIPESERPTIKILHGNFSEFDELLVSVRIPGIDLVLFDLGVSSYQIDAPERGFAFKSSAPLDMRMDPGKQTLTAEEIINTLDEKDLARIIRDNSDEKWAKRIASFIVEARKEKPIRTSDELVEVIKSAIPASARRAGGHPAKRTFQALRIEVNDELGALKRGLDAAIRWLNPGGKIAVISYHSLEDRIVKETFASFADRCDCPPDLPICACGKKPILQLITKKPITPSVEEIDRNPRARSAKLRVAGKL